MSGFSAEWLHLREPCDEASRSRPLIELLRDQVNNTDVIRVVDLGTGTGANLRFMAPLLGGVQEWLLIDNDADLLAQLPQRMSEWARYMKTQVEHYRDIVVVKGPAYTCHIKLCQLDFSADWNKVCFAGYSLVTASALLDLVSSDWLRRLAVRCYEAHTAVCFALTYDGRVKFHPAVDGDRTIHDQVNRHQHSDKGFGPALGPTAPAVSRQVFSDLHYEVRTSPSDWHLGPDEETLETQVLDGWLEAALETCPDESLNFERWRNQRNDLQKNHQTRLTVGHEDLVGWLR